MVIAILAVVEKGEDLKKLNNIKIKEKFIYYLMTLFF